MILSVDPGVVNCGIALVDLTGRVVWADSWELGEFHSATYTGMFERFCALLDVQFGHEAPRGWTCLIERQPLVENSRTSRLCQALEHCVWTYFRMQGALEVRFCSPADVRKRCRKLLGAAAPGGKGWYANKLLSEAAYHHTCGAAAPGDHNVADAVLQALLHLERNYLFTFSPTPRDEENKNVDGDPPREQHDSE